MGTEKKSRERLSLRNMLSFNVKRNSTCIQQKPDVTILDVWKYWTEQGSSVGRNALWVENGCVREALILMLIMKQLAVFYS